VHLRLAPFFDYGRSWNDGTTGEHKNIASAGAGLLLDYKRLNGRLYLAKAFDDINRDNVDKNLQDEGVYFSVSYSVF
jgi:hemolysin activation/secretion protein